MLSGGHPRGRRGRDAPPPASAGLRSLPAVVGAGGRPGWEASGRAAPRRRRQAGSGLRSEDPAGRLAARRRAACWPTPAPRLARDGSMDSRSAGGPGFPGRRQRSRKKPAPARRPRTRRAGAGQRAGRAAGEAGSPPASRSQLRGGRHWLVGGRPGGKLDLGPFPHGGAPARQRHARGGRPAGVTEDRRRGCGSLTGSAVDGFGTTGRLGPLGRRWPGHAHRAGGRLGRPGDT